MDPNHGRDPSIMFWISFKITLSGPSFGPAGVPCPSIDQGITIPNPCPIFCHVDGDLDTGKIKERFGASTIHSDEIIYLYMIEELCRSRLHPSPLSTLQVYTAYIPCTAEPLGRRCMADITFRSSLRAAIGVLTCIVPQSFRGRASNGFVHFYGLVYFSLQRSRTSISVAEWSVSILSRSTFAIGVSFTINAGTSQLVSTQGYTTYEIVDYFNVVMLSSIEVMQV